ncbi:transposase [Streptomyces sp. MCA2]|uniref:transposase n=1 Tax=Streptomyces sp. MCA2 TaxID=2944805 RepID=UPI0035ABF3FC
MACSLTQPCAALTSTLRTTPVERSSGSRQCRRLNRGGDRQANAALHRIVQSRLHFDPRTQDDGAGSRCEADDGVLAPASTLGGRGSVLFGRGQNSTPPRRITFAYGVVSSGSASCQPFSHDRRLARGRVVASVSRSRKSRSSRIRPSRGRSPDRRRRWQWCW